MDKTMELDPTEGARRRLLAQINSHAMDRSGLEARHAGSGMRSSWPGISRCWDSPRRSLWSGGGRTRGLARCCFNMSPGFTSPSRRTSEAIRSTRLTWGAIPRGEGESPGRGSWPKGKPSVPAGTVGLASGDPTSGKPPAMTKPRRARVSTQPNPTCSYEPTCHQ